MNKRAEIRLSDLFVKHSMAECWPRCNSVPSDEFKGREYLLILKDDKTNLVFSTYYKAQMDIH